MLRDCQAGGDPSVQRRQGIRQSDVCLLLGRGQRGVGVGLEPGGRAVGDGEDPFAGASPGRGQDAQVGGLAAVDGVVEEFGGFVHAQCGEVGEVGVAEVLGGHRGGAAGLGEGLQGEPLAASSAGAAARTCSSSSRPGSAAPRVT